MTKSVSNIVTASTVVAVAATAINQAEALNDRQHNRLRALQEEGEDASASTSLSMLTNVESISTLINDEEPKFQEKKKEMDIGILMSSVMSKNSELTDKVSQALDQMEDWDKQELGGKVNDLVDLVKHLLPRGKSGKSKSGKGSKASGDDEEVSTTSTSSTVQSTTKAPGTCTYNGRPIGPYPDDVVSRYQCDIKCCEDSDCLGNDRGTLCDYSKKACYCENARNRMGEVADGDCCYYNNDCASYISGGQCDQSGFDYFCSPPEV